MWKRNRYLDRIQKIRRPLSRSISTMKIRPFIVPERLKKRGKIEHRNLSSTSNTDHTKSLVDDILRAQASFVESSMTGSVFLDDDSVLIRLKEIDETNFECLFSTIKRLCKDWEITKVDGKSFLKIIL